MTIRDDLLTAARDLLIAVSDATDDKVINRGAKGPRPAKPYVTVHLLTPGQGIGAAERIDGVAGSGAPQVSMQERREATVSLQGYGSGSYDWLDALQLGLDGPTSLAAQAASGVAAMVQSGLADLSAVVGTAEETRCSLELRLRYRYTSDPTELVLLQRTEATLELERHADDSDTLNADFALDANGDLT